MEERKDIDAGLRALLDEHVSLRQEAEMFKSLYEKTTGKLVEVNRQISEAIAPEITAEQPLISYTIEETYEQPTRGKKAKELDKDFSYMVADISPQTDDHGLSICVIRSVRVLSERESLLRFLQRHAEKFAKSKKDENTDSG